ncbi:MAG TPA: ribosome maturation factor RimM [Phototrophicaceae bacterium]|nr:ribosome maturation factor RimM [Phototrophicaceae bacterium]
MDEPLVPLGEIVATHGLLGWLKLNPFNPGTTALKRGAEVFLDRAGNPTAFLLETSTPHNRQLLIKLQQVDSIEAAADYVGSTLSISESALEVLAPGQYYHYQIIGFEVFTTCGERVGVVQSTLATAAGELYLVQNGSKEHLIPAVKEIIDKIDFFNRTVTIDPPAGLLDL